MMQFHKFTPFTGWPEVSTSGSSFIKRMIKRISGYIAAVCSVFLGTVLIIKLIADAFARFVLWTAHIWGMEYK